MSDKNKPVSIDDKIREIQDRIKVLYEKQIPLSVNPPVKPDSISEIIKKKAENINYEIQQSKSLISDDKTSETGKILAETREQVSQNYSGDTIRDSKSGLQKSAGSQSDTFYENENENRAENPDSQKEVRSDGLNSVEPFGEKPQDETDINSENISSQKSSATGDKLPQQLFDSFYNEKTDKIKQDNVIKERLEKMEDHINQIKDGLSSFDTETSEPTAPFSSDKEKIIEQYDTIVDKIPADKEVIDKKITYKHGPIMLRPKEKKAGLFNDVNLTEDYELGFRFYQFGFKTGFFNVKLDEHDESSRIATAEFFPNRFWTSVKQRSRWVAGIVFQNWAAHKWKGSIATKYFLFRDRKSFFSFFGAFLSNILLIYLIVSLILKALGYYNMYSLVGHSSVLWYLMIANLIFMVSRLSHRFIFTYNWYGLGYAFFSLFRLPLDTVINFFAIARSMSVYRNTKSQKKVVWDSTSHY